MDAPVGALNRSMPAIHARAIPDNTLLRRYDMAPGYADCYVAELPGAVSQQAFITAFYTSPLFKVERHLLQLLAARPATDADVSRLAAGQASTFSAWRVEAQTDVELLLADVTGRTRSWLMAQPNPGKGSTLLHFGSAVLPRPARGGKPADMGWAFHALLGFHRLYARLLLSAARRRVAPR
jgi:hypothetical protein